MKKDKRTTTQVLYDIIDWINSYCFQDQTTLAIISHIQYEINNRNEENVSQFVSVSIDNDNIASIYRLSSPIVRIKCLNKGTANLTIVCTLDTNIQKTITINFV